MGLTHLRHLFQARRAVDPYSAQRLARTALSPAIAGCARPAPARSLQLLRAATVGAGELERTPVDVDRPVIVSIAAPPAALRLAHLRPTAVGAGDGGVAREEQALVGERAQPAEASLRGLLPSANGTRAALERLVRGLLRVRSLVAAARAPPRTLALETAALATDEVVIDSVGNRLAREEGPRRRARVPPEEAARACGSDTPSSSSRPLPGTWRDRSRSRRTCQTVPSRSCAPRPAVRQLFWEIFAASHLVSLLHERRGYVSR